MIRPDIDRIKRTINQVIESEPTETVGMRLLRMRLIELIEYIEWLESDMPFKHIKMPKVCQCRHGLEINKYE